MARAATPLGRSQSASKLTEKTVRDFSGVDLLLVDEVGEERSREKERDADRLAREAMARSSVSRI